MRSYRVIESTGSERASVSAFGRILFVVTTGLIVANCGSDPKKAGIDSKYGVRPSPRVVADGQPIPKGGGVEKTGRPYVVAGKLYVPREEPGYSAVGIASWYGAAFHGRQTANGEVFDSDSVSVAHPTMPLPSYVRVTNLLNGRSMIARVNDRGPYHGGRLVDVSERIAHALNFRHLGTSRVRVEYLGRAPIEGDDDERLMATLRTDGVPAQLGGSTPLLLASTNASVPVPVARPTESAAPVQAASSAGQDEGVEEVLSILSGRPAPGTPVPPDRPYAVGATLPLAARFLTPQSAIAILPSLASGMQEPGTPVSSSPAGIPLPPVRPSFSSTDSMKLSFNGGAPSAPLAASRR